MGLSMLVLASMGLGESGVATGEFGTEMTGIAVFDNEMNALGGWALTSESGTNYPVPAPAGGWCAVIAMAMTGRKRRTNSNKGSVQ